MNARRIFLTLGGAGLSKRAPGTVGTVVSAILALPLLYLLPASTVLMLALLVGAIAVREIDKEEQEGASHDSQEIVVDELVGTWIALSMVGFHGLGVVLAVLFFRLFDIWKPSLIGKIDQKVKGGLGVVGDDALAGFFAGLAAMILLGILGRFSLV
ncbi:phosphatidylglycerophosphatase A [Wolinella succinogenes]|uniref:PHOSPHATIDYLGLYCEROPHOSPHATASE A n=1 Tax=Wolinella succinogenes (strain ATCC 29543 / DSM 1740 / CCUG 13145 / JCM 31913 / LMG 7466 / NCTC 11488 / FDC 602W) TaxID=273121 RepID=Q7M821_WOLSU|nr:phosphatidylglycerophosphatase A [Wolinella succinogenes]NLU34700.1 phosphatidylglycerophosphatase A [Wolinella succinogenes]CAE10943.1 PHOSPHATIDYLGLYCEROPHOSPHATASE A [Wolinella succinogenes]VEG81104.1 Phosphatidylglycerophosphatase A [Wolinella succinogenes]HCZ19562.1 phosphatidylglycerophosphatase A [Helicobacter sp.]